MLDTTSTSKTTYGRLGDTLNVIPKYLPVPLRCPFPNPFPPFPLHDIFSQVFKKKKESKFAFSYDGEKEKRDRHIYKEGTDRSCSI
ncbi:hypothetical protein Bca4012_038336 [Brassica carinata]